MAAGFTVAQLALVAPGMGLGWDETVYVSQVSPGVPAAFFSAPRARGISLLVAPVTELTSSTGVLRVFLAILSGAGLFAALCAWRRLRPPGVLALAGLLFAGLWVTEFYGPQAMPNLWVAIGGLAAVGCFLRIACAGRAGTTAGAGASDAGPPPAGSRFPDSGPPSAGGSGFPVAGVSPDSGPPPAGASGSPDAGPAAGGRPRGTGRTAGRGPMAGLAGGLALAALMRPADAVWLALPLFAVVPFVARGRRRLLAALLLGGLAAGGAEWVVEAYLRYGGLLERLHRSSVIEGGLGRHFAVDDQLRALDGRTLCRPCDVPLRHPVAVLWWPALPPLAVGGALLAARLRGRLGAFLPVLCALTAALPYLFLIGYAAPRFLLPAYALLAVPVADLLAWSFTRRVRAVRPVWRGAAAGAVAVGLTAHLAVQERVLVRTVARTRAAHHDYARVAAALRRLGVRPPCLLTGDQAIPIAFYARCASAQVAGNNAGTTPRRIVSAAARETVAVLAGRHDEPPPYARGWRFAPLPGLRRLHVGGAYLAPRPAPAAGRRTPAAG